MASKNLSPKLAQSLYPVKSQPSLLSNDTLETLIHHKRGEPRRKIIVTYGNMGKWEPYGVSQSQRVLSPALLLRKFDQVRDCLAGPLGLTCSEREVVLRLLRYWSYYGQVFPRESVITDEPGCSKATFWRTIRRLRDRGLIQVVNRYVIRPQAQISNLYRLDNLVLIIARYLSEHGVAFAEKWLEPFLSMPGSHFWRVLCPGLISSCRGSPLNP